MEQIKRAGRQFRWIVASLLVLTPLIYVGLFFRQGPLALLQIPATVVIDLNQVSALGKAVMFLIPALTPAVYWLAFYFLHGLAGQYAQGEVFSPSAVRRLRLIGILLLTTDVVYMLQTAITGPLLAGLGLVESFLIIELKLGMSVVGLFVVLISRIMVLALELEEQQRLTI